MLATLLNAIYREFLKASLSGAKVARRLSPAQLAD
jgi:hypothetical protein